MAYQIKLGVDHKNRAFLIENIKEGEEEPGLEAWIEEEFEPGIGWEFDVDAGVYLADVSWENHICTGACANACDDPELNIDNLVPLWKL